MEERLFLVNGLQVHAKYSLENRDRLFIPMLRSFTERQKQLGRRMIVFMAGPPAMGKSTLCLYLEALSRETPGLTPIQCLGLDGFHYSNAYLESHTTTRGGRTVSLRSIKGAHETFDAAALAQLLSQKDPLFPVYDRRIHESISNAIPVTEKILIIEGNWLLLDMFPWASIPHDASIFLHPEDPESLIEKALQRKIAGGFDPEEARVFVNRSDRYNIEFCLNHSRSADHEILVHNNGYMEVYK